MRIAATTFAVLMIGATASAQDEAARKAAVEVAARVPLEKAMKGAPYSAETLIEGTQTLADGNRIVRKTTGRVYRDGEGRTRREEDRVAADGVKTGISIVDPVAGFSYSLDPQQKIAWRTPIGASASIMGKLEAAQVAEQRKIDLDKMIAERKAGSQDAPSAAARARGGEMADADKEKRMIERTPNPAVLPRGHEGETKAAPLEHKVLDGVAVEGRKTTTVIPAGQIGNEQPLTITSEEWRSPELNLLVMTRHSDPRSGDSTYRLINIIRAEPDRSLFMVPPDYEIKETGIRRMLEQSQRK